MSATDLTNPIPSGTDVSLEIPLNDAVGAPFSPTALTLSVFDGAGNALISDQVVTLPSTAGDPAAFVVSASVNTISASLQTDIRRVELTMTNVSGSDVIRVYYVIRSRTPLIVQVNSFQTMEQMILKAADIVDITSFQTSSDQVKIAALIEAYRRLSPREYSVLGLSVFIPRLSSTDYAALDDNFMDALCRAQIIEADSVISGGDDVVKRRESGLMLESIGESKMMFRPGKPLPLGMSRRTFDVLGGYLSWGVSIVRA